MQRSLFPKRIVDDLGPIGNGSTAPRWVRADDGMTYAVKDDTPNVPTLRASEYFWLSVARLISLPASIPDIIVNSSGRTQFCTRRETSAQDASFNQLILLSGGVVQGGRQISRIYAFDLFAANWDRHQGNYLVLSEAGSLVTFAIDFSHVAVYPPLTTPGRDPLNTILNATRQEFPKIIQRYGADIPAAVEIAQRLASLPGHTIDAILSDIPDDWLDQTLRDGVSAWWGSHARTDRAAVLKAGLENGTLI